MNLATFFRPYTRRDVIGISVALAIGLPVAIIGEKIKQAPVEWTGTCKSADGSIVNVTGKFNKGVNPLTLNKDGIADLEDSQGRTMQFQASTCNITS